MVSDTSQQVAEAVIIESSFFRGSDACPWIHRCSSATSTIYFAFFPTHFRSLTSTLMERHSRSTSKLTFSGIWEFFVSPNFFISLVQCEWLMTFSLDNISVYGRPYPPGDRSHSPHSDVISISRRGTCVPYPLFWRQLWRQTDVKLPNKMKHFSI